MTDPKKNGASKESVGGRSKLTNRSEASPVAGEERSESDEVRFQNALEDDEVREVLRALRGAGSKTSDKKRP